MTKKQKVKKIIERLSQIYPHPTTTLHYTTPLQLLIATILSAQANDKVVNQVTPELFQKYKSAEALAKADIKELALDLGKINFRNNKAKNIIAACKIITQKYNGEVPSTMQELDALPGVARKTANVVLGNAFHKAEGIAVDTHVIRLSQKLGLTDSKDPVKIEQDLMKIVPKDKWIDFSHLLINFGRDYCPARPHKYDPCPLGHLCPDS
ncbi:endonuclease III [Patescibacteria group bacterium]|nr:endonuclease III [Patescibacteria group bacterium]